MSLPGVKGSYYLKTRRAGYALEGDKWTRKESEDDRTTLTPEGPTVLLFYLFTLIVI